MLLIDQQHLLDPVLYTKQIVLGLSVKGRIACQSALHVHRIMIQALDIVLYRLVIRWRYLHLIRSVILLLVMLRILGRRARLRIISRRIHAPTPTSREAPVAVSFNLKDGYFVT